MNKLNVAPRTIFCRDNLDVLRGINSGVIDLIYLDPPFNKKKVFAAPVGSSAEGAAFSDIFRREDIKDEWVSSIYFENMALYTFLTHTKTDGISYNYCYLVYMAIRLIECRRILKDTGSIYLHCDPTMSHYLKVVMDCIFGERHFRNEIYWRRHASGQKGSQHAPKRWGSNVDCILFYTKTAAATLDTFQPLDDAALNRKFNLVDERGERYQVVPIKRGKNKGERPNLHYAFRGVAPPPYPNAWALSKARMEEEYQKGNIVIRNGGLERRKYLRDFAGIPGGNDWNDILPASGREYVGYPTQKPLALMERIIAASSVEGDVVLDPFCGCATTCVAAEKLRRGWIGVDVSHRAYDLVRERLKREIPPDLFIPDEPRYTTKPPVRDGGVADVERGYVYVISNPAFPGVYKVGIAKDVNRRLSSYQTSDPKRGYKVEYAVSCTNYIELELAAHRHFDGDRENEWVTAGRDEIIDYIRAKAENVAG